MKKTILALSLLGAIPFATIAQKKSFDAEYMDKKVNPKDDFFQFANGQWVKDNPVPKTESRWSSFNELERDNYIKIEKIFQDLAAEKGLKDIAGFNLLNYYESFISENRNSDQYPGFRTIAELSRSLKLGEKTNSEDFARTVATLHKMGINVFFSFGIEQDLKDINLYVPYISQPRLGLPNKEYYEGEKFKEHHEAYRKYVNALFKRFTKEGKTLERSTADKVIRMEKKLASTMFSPVEMRDIAKNYNPISLKNLKKSADNFNWDVYFKEMGIDISTAKNIVISQMPYLKALNTLFGDLKPSDLKEYLQYEGLRALAPYLNKEYADIHFDFYSKYLVGKETQKSLSHQAIDDITSNVLGDALGKYFVKYYYTEEASKKINELVDNIMVVMKERIENLSWMTDDTKGQALVKLGTFKRKLGYPNKWKDFSSFKLSKDNLTSNIIELRKYKIKENLDKLGKPIDKDEWYMPAHMVNAYYNPLQNEIAFPAGIMQAPFFDINFEDAVNYARIGMVIGHEITHGFDDQGAQFAADGSFSDWWKTEDKEKFTGLTKTYGETFDNFCPIEGHCVNPNLTMGENIADLGGITLAYHAYKRTKEYKQNKKIGGYTPSQRFFISYAQIWKINYTEGELKNRLANDPHSPGMYRVNGPLMNCPEFFDAFGVKEGDKMRNSKDKMIVIW